MRFPNERVGDPKSISLRARLYKILRHLPKESEVLELGCGTGIVTKMLVHRGNRVTAIDYSPEAIRKAKKYEPKASYYCSDIYKFSPSRRYPYVICLEVLEHLKDDLEALRLIYQWLIPGGKTLISVPITKYFPSIHYQKAGHLRHYSAEEIVKKASQAGLQPVYWEEWGSFLRYMALTLFPSEKIYSLSRQGLSLPAVDRIAQILVWLDLLCCPLKTDLIFIGERKR